MLREKKWLKNGLIPLSDDEVGYKVGVKKTIKLLKLTKWAPSALLVGRGEPLARPFGRGSRQNSSPLDSFDVL